METRPVDIHILVTQRKNFSQKKKKLNKNENVVKAAKVLKKDWEIVEIAIGQVEKSEG